MNQKKQHKFETYETFKNHMKNFYTVIQNNNKLDNVILELLIGYTIFSYENIKNTNQGIQTLYNYIGVIKNARIYEKNKSNDSIVIELNPDHIGIYTNKPEIHLSIYNITSDRFSSIEIDPYNKIMIIRCNKCTEKDGRCPFTYPNIETQSALYYLGPLNNIQKGHRSKYYSNHNRLSLSTPIYSSLSSQSSQYSSNYDPRTFPVNPEYSIATGIHQPNKVHYYLASGNTNLRFINNPINQ